MRTVSSVHRRRRNGIKLAQVAINLALPKFGVFEFATHDTLVMGVGGGGGCFVIWIVNKVLYKY